MRILHLKKLTENLEYRDRYIVIDSIKEFNIIKHSDKERYDIHIIHEGRRALLAFQVKEPDEVIENFVKTMNIINNQIIEYTTLKED